MLLTVPAIGWAPANRAPRCGFAVSKYGEQQHVDPAAGRRPTCGNGLRPDGVTTIVADPATTSIEVGPDFAAGRWARRLAAQWQPARAGVRGLILAIDNEPDVRAVVFDPAISF